MKTLVELVLDPDLPESLYLAVFRVIPMTGEHRKYALLNMVEMLANQSPPLTHVAAADILGVLRSEYQILKAHEVLADEAPTDTVKGAMGWTIPNKSSTQEAWSRWHSEKMRAMASPPMVPPQMQELLSRAQAAGMPPEQIQQILRNM